MLTEFDITVTLKISTEIGLPIPDVVSTHTEDFQLFGKTCKSRANINDYPTGAQTI